MNDAHDVGIHDGAPVRKPMRTWALSLWSLIALAAFIGFVSLGNWQVERREWKHDLIAKVDARIHTPAVSAPSVQDWPLLSVEDAYRRIYLTGQYMHDKTALVQATTVLGAGYWVMTPLQTTDGTVVLINRGFVPQKQQNGAWRENAQPSGTITITGLLRLSEPKGGFLRNNDPDGDRWHSRDVAQIAASRKLTNVAPYFVDLDTAPFLVGGTVPDNGFNPHLVEAVASGRATIPDEDLPVAGLTVVSFNDNHLIYLLTWYGLALMVALGLAYLWREEYRLRKMQAKTKSG